MTSGTMAGVPLSEDEQEDRRLRHLGDLIARAIEGDDGAINQLEREGGPAAVDRWLAAVESPEYAERRALAEKVAGLRGSARIGVALATLSNARHAEARCDRSTRVRPLRSLR